MPYRHPLLTARVSAMLHEISGGRFALGVGVGVGTITQITKDIRFLAGLGADLIILDPNPGTPRPRDYARERNDPLAVRAALDTNG